MTFKSFNLIRPLLEALEQEKHHTPTPVQQNSLPSLLEGRDLLGFAQTGTGKTAAFLLPILNRIGTTSYRAPHPSVLILVPTRELARQIGEAVKQYGSFMKINHVVIYGGVPVEEQQEQMSQQVDIVVATPGRLLDLMERNIFISSDICQLVLDEADQMLDLGFSEDLQRIVSALPEDHQSMLFSATMPEGVVKLAEEILKDPVKVNVSPVSSTTELIEQKVYYIERENKRLLLMDFLRKAEVESAIVFTKTRKSADLLNAYLQEAGFTTDRLHSERSQHARETIITAFRNKELPVLIATDIAARGIDISHITHVFNYELPQASETYVHRVGRTGRAGKEGLAITLCDPDEVPMLTEIQKLTRRCIPVVENHTYATLSLKKALLAADDKMKQKAAEKKSYRGSKANGDFFRRQKRAMKNKK